VCSCPGCSAAWSCAAHLRSTMAPQRTCLAAVRWPLLIYTAAGAGADPAAACYRTSKRSCFTPLLLRAPSTCCKPVGPDWPSSVSEPCSACPACCLALPLPWCLQVISPAGAGGAGDGSRGASPALGIGIHLGSAWTAPECPTSSSNRRWQGMLTHGRTQQRPVMSDRLSRRNSAQIFPNARAQAESGLRGLGLIPQGRSTHR